MSKANINDFQIINKIGTPLTTLLTLFPFAGTGAFSEVFKVTRKSDGKTYALKKVTSSMLTDCDR